MQELKDSPTRPSTAISREILVDPALPLLKGHFPGAPIVPAALLIEWMLETLPGGNDGTYAWTVTQAKFAKTVKPGMAITISATLTNGSYRVNVTSVDGTHASAKFRRDK